jgi:O-acetyl-ADP-ribose deacetylase (regulator of RNase III)
MRSFNIYDRNIVEIPTDCIITAIGPNGWWLNGGINDSIMETAKSWYGADGAEVTTEPIQDGGQLVIYRQRPPQAIFGAVMFVVDETSKCVYDIVRTALSEADEHGFTRVSIPAFGPRAVPGIMDKGHVSVKSIAHAILDFNPVNIYDVNVVVNQDPYTASLLFEELPV